VSLHGPGWESGKEGTEGMRGRAEAARSWARKGSSVERNVVIDLWNVEGANAERTLHRIRSSGSWLGQTQARRLA
jgi:hypothetical protein